ncbi:MAG TPA: MDR family MFS transporter [Bryobacteraceae bacterium]|jgi:EmrB/QacA subfamily drug resistance transporter|nr:MDR family MFS transporter [Bryobacteraceae bacterium]
MGISAAEPKLYTSGFVRLTRPQFIGTMAGLMMCLLLAALDQTIVGTAEPRIIASLSGFDRYPWVATTYLLTSTICLPVFAKLSDIYGRKWFFLAGAAMFVASSALCGAAGKITLLPIDGMSQLILFRGLQGLGAGIMFGLVFTIVGDVFSPIERGKYQGLFAAMFGAASIFGPTLGGWLTDNFSWRACFYVNLPVGVLAIAAIYFEFPNFKPRQMRRIIDWWGVLTLASCLVPLLLALTWVTDYGWGSARVETLLAAAAVMLAAFLFVETRAKEPVLPLTLFRDPVISICSFANFIVGIGMFGVIIYLPLYMQGVLGVSATRSGSLLTPMMLAAVFGNIFGGQVTSRSGKYKTLAIAGTLFSAAGMIVFARMGLTTPHVMVIAGMVLSGIGLGFVQPVYTVAVQNAAPREHMGTATASTQFFRSIGSTVGVAAFGSVLLTMYKHDFAAAVPRGTPDIALRPFHNPLLLPLIRPQLESAFGQYPGGTDLLNRLFENVKFSLVHGIQVIFFWGAVIMSAAVLLNLALREIPLRGRVEAPPAIE